MKIKVTKDLCEIKENEIWNVGDYNVHTVQVELSPEFNGLVNKVRYFVEDKSYDMLITDNVAQVPYEATVMEGTIKIGVYGYDADTDILVQSTSPVNKYITSGTYTGDPDNTQPLTPTDKEQMETAIQKNTNDITDLKANKQDKLISGVNIKTINNESILSSGNLTLVTEETDPIFANSPAYSITDNDITYWNNKANMSDIPDVSNFITKDVDDLTYYTKSTDMQNAIDSAVNIEKTARENADVNLQNQIDAITVSSDVVDVVSTYQDLVDYDTQHIKANDIIKVMQDSTHDNAISYYRWVIVNNVGSWVYVGSEGPYYTKSETDTLLNAKQNTITTTNKLQSDLVDDTNQTNLFVTSAEKTTWNNKLDQSDLTDYVKNTDYASSSTGGVIKTGSNVNVDNNGVIYTDNQTYSDYSSSANTTFISKGTLENVITGKNLETANNKVTSISSESTDTQYPSAKCVYDNDVIIKDDVNTKYDYLFSLTNLFGKITGTGTSVTLNDTSNTIMKLNLDTTTSSQESTTGKNLLPSTLTSQTINGVTVTRNSDGSITLNGTTNANTDFKWFEGEIQLEAGTYYIGLISTSSDFNLYSIGSNGTNIIQNPVNNPYTTLTLASNTTFTRLSSYVYSGKTFNNETFYPIICKELPVEYEPYTGGQPAPSPSYPQEIHTVTGDNEIDIVGKNLFDLDWVAYRTTNGITATKGEDCIVLNGTATATAYINFVFPSDITSIIDTTAHTWFSKTTQNITKIQIQRDTGGVVNIINPTTLTKNTFGNTLTGGYVEISSGTTLNNCKVYIDVRKGILTLDGYEFAPYQSQNYTISLGNTELCKIGDYQDILFKNTINSEYYNSSLELNKWYKLNNIEKKLFKGGYDEEWNLLSNTNKFYINLNRALGVYNKMFSNYYTYNVSGQANLSNGEFTNIGGEGTYLWFRNDDISSANDFKTWLSTHNTIVYYPLATPTYTLLNDTLQTQLDNLQYALAYDTQTNISQTNTDLPFIINAETYVKINVPTKTSDLINDSDFINSSYHDDTKQDVIDNTLTTINKTIPTAINEVDSIAKGANQALSYGNYQTMITAFNSLANNVYNVGQNVMIITLQVPDLWISGIESTSQTYTYTTDEAFTTELSTNGYVQVGYYKLSALETQKVNLTDYEQNTNKTTTISSSSTNTEYPSAKAVYDYIQSLNGDEVNY